MGVNRQSSIVPKFSLLWPKRHFLTHYNFNSNRKCNFTCQINCYHERLPQPIIAVVNGSAMGGGCVCAFSCDFRLASHTAQFAMPEVSLGWPPGYGISQLTRLIGKARTLELCLTAKSISSKTALEWGLVNEVISDNRLLVRAGQLANELLAMPHQALVEAKRLIHSDEGSLPKCTWQLDTEAYIRCLQSDEAQEGMRAFVEKRKPRYS